MAEPTKVDYLEIGGVKVRRYINEFWTSRQRQANPIHEVSYRACFKPQLPRFFIEMLTQANDVVYDPFSGRGTTAIEAGLLGRNVVANDINPLSKVLTKPRLCVPEITEISERLDKIKFYEDLKNDEDLSMFYHQKTESEIISLKNYLAKKKGENQEDEVDEWIRMVATNRLTGHSSGFFSVYTLPPNLAVSPKRQVKINERYKQTPEYRDVKKIIFKKSLQLLSGINTNVRGNLRNAYKNAKFVNCDAGNTKEIKSNSVNLTVTSPPFLDIVQYANDNWLRCWFNNIATSKVEITMAKTTEQWQQAMSKVFAELYRITKVGGWVAFEVGELKNGKIKLDELVLPIGIKSGFQSVGIIINSQQFTKTANLWGVANNSSGTNTNRIVLFQKHN